MSYKVYRESRLPDLGWEDIKKQVLKPINAHKHREDRLYHDDEHLWFWHDGKRKRVRILQIKTVQKASLHGFGAMINIIYKSSDQPEEDGKKIELHLVDVANLDEKPSDIAKRLNGVIEEQRKNETRGRRKYKFPGADEPSEKS